jgi:hypothetical protein
MGLADWLLSKSAAFKILLLKFKEHKSTTQESFMKVRRDNALIVKKLREHDERLDAFERNIKEMHVEPIKVYEKKKK